MAILSDISSSTVLAIYEAWEKNHTDYDSVGLGIGELGNECDRALWYSLRWASKPEPKTGKKLRRFETGNITETRIINELKRVPGVTVVDIDAETGRQIKVYSHGGHVRGKLDGKVYGLPEAPKTWHVVEVKALNKTRFAAVVKHGLQAKEPKHWFQCQKYMELTGLTRALYICQNTDNDELHAERIEFDPVAIVQMNVRIERIISQNTAPSRISENPDKWPCLFCQHKDVCHGSEFGRNHCRTCLNSTPIIDDESTDATWLCEKFGVTLSIDDQKAGGECPEHRFLPDVVPGTQTDVIDGDKLVYEMRDGSQWVDGVKAQ